MLMAVTLLENTRNMIINSSRSNSIISSGNCTISNSSSNRMSSSSNITTSTRISTGSLGSVVSVGSVHSVFQRSSVTSGRSEDEYSEEEEDDASAKEEERNEEQATAWLAYSTAITYAVMLCQHERAAQLTEALRTACGGSETLFTSAFLPYQSLLLPLTIEQTVAIARAAAEDIVCAAALLPALAPPQVLNARILMSALSSLLFVIFSGPDL
jgi:hypothetical protein